MSEKAHLPRVSFLGPAGTYSHAAALQLFPAGGQWLPVGDIPEVFALVESGGADWGVVPVENSTEGSVLPTLDGFVFSSLCVAAESLLRIQHCLLVSELTRAQGIARIAAHPQALGQCRNWLREHFPNVPLLPVNSNAEAALMAGAQNGVAAIAGKAAADLYELVVLHASIEDSVDNTTRFWQVGKTCDTHSTGHDRTSLIIKAHNEPGTLFRALEPFHRFGISLTKLESRPSRKSAWSYLFYVDLEGHLEDAPVASALQELAHLAIEVQLLGSYPAAVNV